MAANCYECGEVFWFPKPKNLLWHQNTEKIDSAGDNLNQANQLNQTVLPATMTLKQKAASSEQMKKTSIR